MKNILLTEEKNRGNFQEIIITSFPKKKQFMTGSQQRRAQRLVILHSDHYYATYHYKMLLCTISAIFIPIILLIIVLTLNIGMYFLFILLHLILIPICSPLFFFCKSIYSENQYLRNFIHRLPFFLNRGFFCQM